MNRERDRLNLPQLYLHVRNRPSRRVENPYAVPPASNLPTCGGVPDRIDVEVGGYVTSEDQVQPGTREGSRNTVNDLGEEQSDGLRNPVLVHRRDPSQLDLGASSIRRGRELLQQKYVAVRLAASSGRATARLSCGPEATDQTAVYSDEQILDRKSCAFTLLREDAERRPCRCPARGSLVQRRRWRPGRPRRLRGAR